LAGGDPLVVAFDREFAAIWSEHSAASPVS
jgi:hypothetical protein